VKSNSKAREIGKMVFVKVDNTQGSKNRCLMVNYLNVYDGVTVI